MIMIIMIIIINNNIIMIIIIIISFLGIFLNFFSNLMQSAFEHYRCRAIQIHYNYH